MVIKAGILVYDNFNNKILTINNQYGDNIGLPKGNIDVNETAYKAAFRELYEETGLSFKIFPKIEKEFTINKIKIYIIKLPNGSICNFNPNDNMLKENIYTVKWRTYKELEENESKLNYTLKKKKNQKIFEKIKNLFKT